MRYKKILLIISMIFTFSFLGYAQDNGVTNATITGELGVPEGNEKADMLWKSQTLSLSPTFTIGAEPFTDPERNFVPSSNISYAGDINGDGYDDFYYTVLTGDETTEDLSDRVSKMVVFYGSEDGISEADSELLVNSFTFLTDLNGDGISESIRYEDGVLSLIVDESDGSLETLVEIELLEISGLRFQTHGDYDGDGFNDLLAYRSVSSANTGSFYMIYGANSIDDVRIDTLDYSSGPQGAYNKMAYADVNNDGTSEIINVSSFPSQEGVFGAITAYQINNGELEMVASDSVSTDIITNQLDVNSFGTYMGLADLNNDDNYELMFFNYYTGKFYVFEVSDQEGEIYTDESIAYSDTDLNIFAIIGDYNNDGGTDLIVAGDTRVQLVTADANLNMSSTHLEMNDGDFVNFVQNPTENVNGGGDVDGDGIDDIVLEYSNSDAGIYGYRVYFGNNSGSFDNTSEVTYNRDDYTNDTPRYVFNAGDLNADGIEDYGIVYSVSSDVHLFFGGAVSDEKEPDFIIEHTNQRTIYSPSVGDFNGDGVSDLLLSKSRTGVNDNNGEMNLYFGGADFDTDADYTLQYSDEYSDVLGSFGNAASVGDINNDGADDILFASEDEASTTRILYGGESMSATSDETLPFFAWNFSTAGDFNADGITDFVVTYNNMLYVHSGFDGPEGESFDAEPLSILTVPAYGQNNSTATYSFFGHSIAAGDFDGDGVSDIAATAVYHYDVATNEGVPGIRLYKGGAEADSVVDGQIAFFPQDFANINNETERDTLGQNLGTIATVQDQNGDGAQELVFAAYGFLQTNAALYYGGELDTMGTSIGVHFEAPNQAIGLGPHANFIYARRGVPAIGDYDNDGRNDFALAQVGEFNFLVDPVYIYSSDQIGVGNEEELSTVADFRLNQNYPNPFNPTTKINYTIPSAGEVTLKVYDITGRLVSTVVDQRQTAGSHTLNFDASALASGIYIYRLQSAGLTQTRKMTLIK